MKLHWFSPLPPARTGIADFTATVIPALREIADVTLWTDQTSWGKEVEAFARVVHYDPARMPWRELNEADACIYNIGNNCLYHSGIWRVSSLHPGIVVLHDVMLHDLFYGLHKLHTRDKEAYLDDLVYHHGEAARRDGEDLWEGRAPIENVAPKYPLVSMALKKAIGAVMHTESGFESLRQSGKWLAAHIPLASSVSPVPQLSAGGASMTGEKVFRLIIFGHIGRNRRLEQFIQALHLFHDRVRFHLHVYGEIWNEPVIASLVESLGLSSSVTLHGFAPTEELEMALAASDLAINLRYPTMGEASISQLQIWRHSLPALVTPVGWYANLPRDVVAFVDPENEVAEIHRHLNAFLDNPAAFREMGKAGRRRLEEEHSPAVYAKNIVDFTALALRSRHSRPFLEDLPLKAASILGDWTPAGKGGVTVARVAGELLNLGGFRKPFSITFDKGWHDPEMDERGETWIWSSGDAEITLFNPTGSPCGTTLDFELGSINRGSVVVFLNRVKLLETPPLLHTEKIELPVVLKPGENRLFFENQFPPSSNPGSDDPRLLGFVLRQFCKT